MEGKQFKHKKGHNRYKVIFLANTEPSPEEHRPYPEYVVYTGEDGRVWTRSLSDWNKNFIEL